MGGWVGGCPLDVLEIDIHPALFVLLELQKLTLVSHGAGFAAIQFGSCATSDDIYVFFDFTSHYGEPTNCGVKETETDTEHRR